MTYLCYKFRTLFLYSHCGLAAIGSFVTDLYYSFLPLFCAFPPPVVHCMHSLYILPFPLKVVCLKFVSCIFNTFLLPFTIGLAALGQYIHSTFGYSVYTLCTWFFTFQLLRFLYVHSIIHCYIFIVYTHLLHQYATIMPVKYHFTM